MRKADQLVDVLKAGLVFRQDYYVICTVLLDVDASVFSPGVLVRIKIALDSVDDLYRASGLGLLARFLCCIRESLHDTVVGYRDSRLAPVRSLLYYIFDLIEAVIVAHLCVAVKLYPASVRIGIFLESLLYLLEREAHHEVLVFICVVFYAAAGSYHIALRQILLDLLELVFRDECLHPEGPYF